MPCRCPPACCPGSLAYDMMYGPAAQGFLDWAQAHGAVARRPGHAGGTGRRAFAIWRGVRPPSAQVLEELRRAPALTQPCAPARHAP